MNPVSTHLRLCFMLDMLKLRGQQNFLKDYQKCYLSVTGDKRQNQDGPYT